MAPLAHGKYTRMSIPLGTTAKSFVLIRKEVSSFQRRVLIVSIYFNGEHQ